MGFIDILLYGLATWRISSLFVNEEGPGDIFEKFRKKIDIAFGIPDARFVPEVFSCVWCLSLWVGAVFFLLDVYTPDLAVMLATPFALSAFAILFDTTVNRG